jgi:hypothetical protein
VWRHDFALRHPTPSPRANHSLIIQRGAAAPEHLRIHYLHHFNHRGHVHRNLYLHCVCNLVVRVHSHYTDRVLPDHEIEYLSLPTNSPYERARLQRYYYLQRHC